MTIAFTKMQGIGNDYVYVDATSDAVVKHLASLEGGESGLSKRMSNRNFGVGSDGLILIKRSRVAGASHRMHMYNSDGSESEMCGNGIRCVAKWLYDRSLEKDTRFGLETGAGVLTVELTPGKGHTAELVRINMGKPRLTRGEIPMTGPASEQAVNQPINAAGKDWRFTGVSMGNPHCVVFVDDPDALELPVIGPKFEHHALFPRRTNTEFVKVLSRERVQQRTWERGAGETLACGTGASAVCVAGVLNNLTNRKITIELRGGDLQLEWNEQDGCVYKTGPAVEVYSGVWPE